MGKVKTNGMAVESKKRKYAKQFRKAQRHTIVTATIQEPVDPIRGSAAKPKSKELKWEEAKTVGPSRSGGAAVQRSHRRTVSTMRSTRCTCSGGISSARFW